MCNSPPSGPNPRASTGPSPAGTVGGESQGRLMEPGVDGDQDGGPVPCPGGPVPPAP